AYLHLYGKDVAAPGRKMGHVTRLFGNEKDTQDHRRARQKARPAAFVTDATTSDR
ncbi:MAG: hypothetical protein JOZ30_02045, partial [Hyphomicrobiales bacterium]|nr:hypothetical protein [Hyphomicrobiales bacterium]